jgi:hypothetical protein
VVPRVPKKVPGGPPSPRVRHIMTSNAGTNAHMIGINETLGYRVIGRTERSWELPAARVTQS